jgi:hypothetical protein
VPRPFLAPTWRHLRAALLIVPLVAAPLVAQGPSTADRVDDGAVAKIKDEGFNRSQVMDVMSWLTDVHGARLTGSPATLAAAEWAMKTMTGWGLAKPHLETWGPFGRGWSNERMSLQITAPQHWAAIAYPSAWTPGTKGPVSASAVLIQIDSEADLGKYEGKLRGKMVLVGAPRDVPARYTAQGARYTDEQLAKMAAAEPQAAGGRGQFGRQQGPTPPARGRCGQPQLQARTLCFLAEQGAVAALLQGRGDDGTVFVSSTGGSRDTVATPMLPTITLAAEHYGRIARTLSKSVPVTMELDVRNTFHDRDRNSFNVVAELPGTDPALKDEVVMLGAHFDSWHTGTGATDNAAGSAVMMEAMRILKASGVPLRRTVRIGLWTGEEEGLLGSRAYVTQHFGDRQTMRLTPEHAKLSGYFNVDNGTGKIRGVYLQGNQALGPIFDAWMAPFKDSGMKTLTIANTGGTDHQSFDAVGLPGFQFIQDEIEYGSRTHHSNMDLYERVQPDDMKWNAVVVATFAMQTANRDERLPRKALPEAQPPRAVP